MGRVEGNAVSEPTRGLCLVCFGKYLIRKDGMIRHHSGPLIRHGRFAGSGWRCSGAGLKPYTGPTCPETGKLCPKSRDLRRCVHDASIVIAIAWMPSVEVQP